MRDSCMRLVCSGAVNSILRSLTLSGKMETGNIHFSSPIRLGGGKTFRRHHETWKHYTRSICRERPKKTGNKYRISDLSSLPNCSLGVAVLGVCDQGKLLRIVVQGKVKVRFRFLGRRWIKHTINGRVISLYIPYFGARLGILEVSSKFDMDFGFKQDREGQSGETVEKSLASLGGVSIQESEVNAIQSAMGSDNPEVGTEALTRVVREVLEKVFKASLEKTREMVQGRCMDYGKKRYRSPSRLEPQSAKRVKSQQSVNLRRVSETVDFKY
ncbi:hypothetical protein PVK06_007716 [Gossypium arboreum]|uniref:Uncharacterized protein n=1 Tax=Gossypium arboreum TaxID=29729 RepID=A0ABR0QI37_GOSAR|nr:hypothetical protein PVK06_007716 [Gossypium arboreum]